MRERRHRPAVVQLHSGVGLGNGIGMLYQAKRGGTPARRHRRRVRAPLRRDGRPDGGRSRVDRAAGDEVGDPGRRPGLASCGSCAAPIKIAGTPPTGPVFVCPAGRRPRRAERRAGRPDRRCPPTRGRPDPALVDEAADLLAGAQRPDDHHGRRRADVGRAGGADAAWRSCSARTSGAPTRRRSTSTRRHPLFRGQSRPHVRAITAGHSSRRPTRSSSSGRTSSRRSSRRWPDVFAAGGAGRPHRPRRLRDRQELPGRPRARQRSRS